VAAFSNWFFFLFFAFLLPLLLCKIFPAFIVNFRFLCNARQTKEFEFCKATWVQMSYEFGCGDLSTTLTSLGGCFGSFNLKNLTQPDPTSTRADTQMDSINVM